MTSRDVTVFERILQGGVLAGLLTPLFITPGLAFPFHSGRTIFFGILIALLLVPWFLLIIRSPEHRPRFTWPLGALLFFLFVSALTAITGIDPAQSFWGRDERMMGTVTLMYAGLWTLMAVTVFRGRRAFRVPLGTAVAIAALVALISIHEHFFPGPWRVIAGGGSRVAGTMGNPIFLANYLMPHLFFVLWLGAAANRRLRTVLGVASLVIIAAIIYSGTRGSFLGMAGGVGMVGVAWIATRSGRRRAIAALAALGIAVLLLGGYFGARTNPALFHNPTLGPLLQISPRLITAQERLLLWQIAWRAWESRPLLGWGPENFDYAYDRHYDPRFLRFSLHETWVDRAHNVFLDALVTSGVLGLLALLGISFVPFVMIWRAKRSGSVIPGEAIAAAGFAAAVLTQNISAFDTLPSLLVSFMFVGLASAATTPTRTTVVRVSRIVGVAAVLAVVALVAAVLFVNVKTARAARALSRALHAGRVEEVQRFGRAALERWHPFQPGFRLRFGNLVFLGAGNRFTGDHERELLDLAATEYRKTLIRTPQDFKTLFSLANLEFIRGIDLDVRAYDVAEVLYREALLVSPKRQIVLFQLGNMQLIRGDAAAAVQTFSDAVAADSKSPEPWWHLGRALMTAASQEPERAPALEADAYDAFERSRSLSYVPVTAADVEASLPLYAKRGDYAGALWIAEQGVQIAPRNVDFWIQLAVIAGELGLRDRAIAAIDRAVLLDPSLRAEADAFKQSL